ncbi:MAG: hypothetical protein WCK98_07450 [bacterium]
MKVRGCKGEYPNPTTESNNSQQVIRELASIRKDAISHGEKELLEWEEKIAVLNINQCKSELSKIQKTFQNQLNLESGSVPLLADIKTILEARIASLEKETLSKKIKTGIIAAVMALSLGGIGAYNLDQQNKANDQANRIQQAQTYDELKNASPDIESIEPTTAQEKYDLLVELRAIKKDTGLVIHSNIADAVNALGTIKSKVPLPETVNDSIAKIAARKNNIPDTTAVKVVRLTEKLSVVYEDTRGGETITAEKYGFYRVEKDYRDPTVKVKYDNAGNPDSKPGALADHLKKTYSKARGYDVIIENYGSEGSLIVVKKAGSGSKDTYRTMPVDEGKNM